MAVGIRRMSDVGLSTSILKFNSMISSIDYNSTPNISSPYKHTPDTSSHSPIGINLNNRNVPITAQSKSYGLDGRGVESKVC
jgi:hypothetical protein